MIKLNLRKTTNLYNITVEEYIYIHSGRRKCTFSYLRTVSVFGF